MEREEGEERGGGKEERERGRRRGGKGVGESGRDGEKEGREFENLKLPQVPPFLPVPSLDRVVCHWAICP